MERVKVALLAVIAVALVVPQLSSLIPTAEAQSGGEVTCYPVRVNAVLGNKPEEAMAKAAPNAAALQEILRQHPGEVVLHTTHTQTSSTSLYGYIETVCIR